MKETETLELLKKLVDDLENNYGSGELSVDTKMLLQKAFYVIDSKKQEKGVLNEKV